MQITVNGAQHEVTGDPAMPLLWALREQLGLTGTKFGCGVGYCRACTVQIDGVAIQSCQVPLSRAEGKSITTIEGLGAEKLHPIQEAWIAHSVPQCGYCQSGVLMALSALAAAEPDFTVDRAVETINNICRCGTYPQMKRALADAIDQMKGAAK